MNMCDARGAPSATQASLVVPDHDPFGFGVYDEGIINASETDLGTIIRLPFHFFGTESPRFVGGKHIPHTLEYFNRAKGAHEDFQRSAANSCDPDSFAQFQQQRALFHQGTQLAMMDQP